MYDSDHISSGDALLIVDMQKDFCAGGALPIEGSEEIVPRVNALIEEAARAGAAVFASRDWHPRDHLSFVEQGGPWPRHCVQGASGADFHSTLCLPPNVVIVNKGDRSDSDQYSAFDRTGLDEDMRKRGVNRVWLCGLALDVCVRATALDSVAAGFPTVLVTTATAPVTAEGGAAALKELARAGVRKEV
ncbi:MAG: isochorismatase family protein [Rhodoblastus sp.]|uniref:isochorismatase family protein n=1 Tax=Rhodoblastus sp. TaxID=1962975 RepID=UPI003F9D0DF2